MAHPEMMHIRRSRVLLALLAACAGDARTGETGDSSDEPAAPETLLANVRVIADTRGPVGTFSPLASSLVADGSGVYWLDADDNVRAARDGAMDVVTLRRGDEPAAPEAPGRASIALGMALDDERIYVGEGFIPTNVVDYFPVPDFEPPGRLLAISKAGGAVTSLLELADGVPTPIAVDDRRLIVFVLGDAGGLYSLDKADGRLEKLPLRAPYFSGRAVSDRIYWSDAEYPPTLLRGRFDDAEPEAVVAMESNDFAVGPGYVLTLLSGGFESAQSFVVYDEATGSSRPLSGTGESVSLERALDARHAYWFSYRAYTTGAVDAYDPDLKLVRASVDTGALTRIITPGLDIDPAAVIVGQRDDTLYVRNGEALLAIDKP